MIVNSFFQLISYGVAVVIPYLMITGSLKPQFYFSFYIFPIFTLFYFADPLTAAGISVFATVVGTFGFIFSINDFKEGIPVVFLFQIGSLWLTFWSLARFFEKKDLQIQSFQEKIEKLEVTLADEEKKQKELKESCRGIQEKISKYEQFRTMISDLSGMLSVKEIQNKTEIFLKYIFGKETDIFVKVDLFSSLNQPDEGDKIGRWLIQHHTPLLANNLSEDHRWAGHHKKGSLISSALEHVGQTFGTLTLESQKTDHWKEDDLRLLSNISNIIAISFSNAYYYEKVEQLAVKDPLTHLFVRYRFNERIEEEFSRSKVSHSPLSLILFDIDHFKKINDKWGHQAGDEVLKLVAQIILKQARETDFCARYGGEEFAAILPFTSKENAFQLAERIRKEIENEAMTIHKISVTVSGGISIILPSMERPSDLIQSADQALYRAKRKGRNQVIISKLKED